MEDDKILDKQIDKCTFGLEELIDKWKKDGMEPKEYLSISLPFLCLELLEHTTSYESAEKILTISLEEAQRFVNEEKRKS